MPPEGEGEAQQKVKNKEAYHGVENWRGNPPKNRPQENAKERRREARASNVPLDREHR